MNGKYVVLRQLSDTLAVALNNYSSKGYSVVSHQTEINYQSCNPGDVTGSLTLHVVIMMKG